MKFGIRSLGLDRRWRGMNLLLVMAYDAKWSELEQRLAARVTERHHRVPRVVWSRPEIGRFVFIELIKLGFDWNSTDRLTDIKEALPETHRLIRADLVDRSRPSCGTWRT